MKTEYTVEIYDGINNEKQTNIFYRNFQKTKINIKRKLGETRKYEIIYELKKPMCGFFEREILINYSSF